MRIGVDTRVLANDNTPLFRNYTYQLIEHLTQKLVQDIFYAFTDNRDDELLKSLHNVTPVFIAPRTSNIFYLKFWYDVKLAMALKEHKIDLFICSNGICSLSTRVPQLLILQSFQADTKTSIFSRASRWFHNRYIKSFLKKSAAIVTVSQYLKDAVENKYLAEPGKISVAGFGVSSFFEPVEWEEREAIKTQHSDGYEYFIFGGDIHPANNLTNVLKAFSIFKKWQKSGMKLIIATSDTKYLKPELNKLSNYKYRNDVLVKINLPGVEFSKLVAGSYASIITPLTDTTSISVLEALQSESPIIAAKSDNIVEVAGEGALYVDPTSPEQIAEAMKTVFKDENLRAKIIATGKQRAQDFTWAKATEVVSRLIEQAVSK